MDRGAWRVIVHRVAKSQARLKQLSYAHTDLLFKASDRTSLVAQMPKNPPANAEDQV